jgi:hypothetical protein
MRTEHRDGGASFLSDRKKGRLRLRLGLRLRKRSFSRRLPHPEGVKDGSRSVEAGRDLRNSVGWEMAPRRGASVLDELARVLPSKIVGMGSGTASGVQGIRGLDPGVARGR